MGHPCRPLGPAGRAIRRIGRPRSPRIAISNYYLLARLKDAFNHGLIYHTQLPASGLPNTSTTEEAFVASRHLGNTRLVAVRKCTRLRESR